MTSDQTSLVQCNEDNKEQGAVKVSLVGQRHPIFLLSTVEKVVSWQAWQPVLGSICGTSSIFSERCGGT